MNIDELEAGRELDALVAKEIMGWRQEYVRNIITGEVCGMWKEPEYLVPPRGDDAVKVPAHSDDTGLAWEVLEKGASKAEGWVRLRERVQRGGVWWECDFGDYGEAARGPTVSLAICRAALKTMGVGNQDNYLVVKW